MKKSIISATIRFQSGGIENSCHSFWDSLGVRGGGVCSFRCCSVPLWVAVGPEDDDDVTVAKNMKKIDIILDVTESSSHFVKVSHLDNCVKKAIAYLYAAQSLAQIKHHFARQAVTYGLSTKDNSGHLTNAFCYKGQIRYFVGSH